MSLIKLTVDPISPNYCMLCRFNACHDELPICNDCISEFQELISAKCVKCGKSAFACKCRGDDATRFLFFYGDPRIRSMIYYFKENTDERNVAFIAELLVRATGIKIGAFTGVTFVPRAKQKIRRIGYDQARILAEAISKIYEIPLLTALERNPRTKEQKLLSKGEREKEADNYFRSVEPLPKTKYKRLLLIDDVMTTGATVRACTKLLKRDYADSVVSLVIAKTPSLK